MSKVSDRQPSVLIVDDTPANIQVLGSMLKQEGYSVSVATSGQQGIDIAQKIRPDIILLDVNMPGMDGFEACKRLKAMNTTKDIPIIFLTAQADIGSITEGFSLGAVDYVTKPFDSVELLVRIRTHIELKRNREALVEAKDEAERATQLKDKFVALVAHDVRSPFSSIIGFLKVMENDKSVILHDKHREITKRLIRAGEDMIGMVDQLLDISSLQTGRITPKPTFFDARQLAIRAINNLENLADAKHILIINDLPSSMRVRADYRLFSEVLNNLISNAIKFTRSGGEITLFCPEGKNNVVAVKDNGVGIPLDILPDIFKQEVKTTSLGTAGEKGTGLGLPFCHEIMKIHGGNLMVESTIDKGTIFYAELPPKTPQILIVDDSPTTRSALREALNPLQAYIAEAETGEIALEMVARSKPDLILLDIILPGIDGFAVLEKLRKMEGMAEVPVLIITSDKKEETRTKGFELGAQDFISKTFQKENLLPRVRRFIG